MPRLRPALLLVVLLLSTALSACGGGGQVGSTGDKGYIDGLGAITKLSVADRKKPGPVAGKTIGGRRVSLADFSGRVVVINVWGSWCPPCRAETPILDAAARTLAHQDVVFLGINTRDNDPAQVRAFLRLHHVPYPSIYDPDGQTLLAFDGTLTPNSIPSTVVVDRQGRVAASILGQVTSKQTLVDLVKDVLS
ncbi:MAG: TlpA family protein disulfide reductase [Actinomycetota bacterium]|nr:TlpA family protein disulfide reductase [Actinomycetota bacterium]